jgi:Ulp1 family protease
LDKYNGDYSAAKNDPSDKLIRIVEEVFPFKLTDVGRLLQNDWLVDEIMNAFCCIILPNHSNKLARCETKSRSQSVEFCSLFIDTLRGIIKDKNKSVISEEKYTFVNVSRWTKRFKPLYLNGMVEMNINVANCHWIRGTVDFQTKTVTIRDSQKSD